MSNNIHQRDNKPPESPAADFPLRPLAYFCPGLISRKFNLRRFPTSRTLRCASCASNSLPLFPSLPLSFSRGQSPNSPNRSPENLQTGASFCWLLPLLPFSNGLFKNNKARAMFLRKYFIFLLRCGSTNRTTRC